MFDEMSEKKPDFCTAILKRLQLETVEFEQELFTDSRETGYVSKNKAYFCDFLVMGEQRTDKYLVYQRKKFTFPVPFNHAMTNCRIWTDGEDNMIYYFLNNLMGFNTSEKDRNEYISLFLQNLIFPDDLSLNLLPEVFFFYKERNIRDVEFFLNTFAKIFFTVFITMIHFYIKLRTYLFNNSNELTKEKKTFYINILDSLRFITNQNKKISWNHHYKHYLTIYKQITTNAACAEIFGSFDIGNVSFSSLILLNHNLIEIKKIANSKCHVKIHMHINKENLKKMIHSLSSQTDFYLKNEPLAVSDDYSAKSLKTKNENYNYSITFERFLNYLQKYHDRDFFQKNSETESLTNVTQFLKDHLGIRNVSTSPVYRKFKSNIIKKNFQHAVFNFFQFWFLENNEKTGEYFLDNFYDNWSYVRNSILFLIELIQKSKIIEDSKTIFEDEKLCYMLTEMHHPKTILELKNFFKLYYIEPEHKEVKCKWSFSYVYSPHIETQDVKPQLHFFLFIAKCLNHNPLQHLSGFEYIPTEKI
jgi:hypothetical protein